MFNKKNMDTLIFKIHTFFTKLHKPFVESFLVWETLIKNQTEPKYFWEDLSFFRLYEEDFFDWYRDDDFRELLWERLR
jgi:hypothetical protein